MNINRNQFEVLSIIEKEGGKKLSQRNLANDTNVSLGTVNRVMSELTEYGLISTDDENNIQITKLGMEALEPYRVKRAVVIAAGFGSRMVPITLNTPKPLVRVKGKRIIETVLDAIVEAGVEEIVLVRGYLSEQFNVLLSKYPNIKFLENPLFNDANNISSVLVAKDLLENAYVCEADLVLSNPQLIRKYEYESNYLGIYKEVTDDWCFKVKNNKMKIAELIVGAHDAYQMVGISYWNKEDGKKLATYIPATYHMPGGKEKYWDEVALRVYKSEFEVAVRKCMQEDIIEIDSFKELKEIDPVYAI